MTSILETQVTALLASELGRAPTAAEIANGMISPWILSQIHNDLNVGSSQLTLSPGDDIQSAVDSMSSNGAGTLQLSPGTYNVSTDIVLPSSVVITGIGPGVVIDFGSGAHQIQMKGSNAYATGTLSVTQGSTSVTGSGTTWTNGMVGQSILLEDFWYTVASVGSATSITLDSSYRGTTLSGSTYVIADIISNSGISNVTLQNSSVALVSSQYGDSCFVSDVVMDSGLLGVESLDSSGFQVLNSFTTGCGSGVSINNSHFGTYTNSNNVGNSPNGGNSFVNSRNWTLSAFGSQGCTGNGLSLQGCSNVGIENFAIRQIDGIGIEFVSGNSDIGVLDGDIEYCTSDAIKITGSTDGIVIGTANTIRNNTGWGVNIANANCDTNIVIGNSFSNNTAGNVTDSGTGTLIRSNGGVADN